MALPPGRVCAHTPVAVKRVDSFGDFDIVDAGTVCQRGFRRRGERKRRAEVEGRMIGKS